MAISSFDVFDTVLVREVGAPEAVITELSRELEKAGEISFSPTSFETERRRQERRLNQLLGRHADLREIHREVASSLSVGEDVGSRWAAAEEDLERRLTVAAPGAARRLAEARAVGDQVVFISDTPHSEAFLTELLTMHGLLQPGDRVFTSSERGQSKSQGGLFALVADLVEADGPFKHVGDNEASDLAAPRAEGWVGRHLTRGQQTKYERVLESHAPDTDTFTSWLAGASRLARLEAEERGMPAALAGVASGALAPMLVGYALWVLGQARLRGTKRLYYVARDGRVMLDAARPILERMAPDIELRYLYGSRHPWTLGASAFSDDVLRRWLRTKSDHTARTALARLGLTPEQVHAVRPLPFTSSARCDTVLTAAERDQLVAALQEDDLLPMVRAAAMEQAEATMAYLRQEGLCDQVPSALVDAGWGGRTAQAFDILLEAAGGLPVPHLVMGITGNAKDARNREGVQFVPWLFDEQAHSASLAGLRSPNVLVEMFCADATGRTMGYRRNGERVEPVLEVERNEPVISWGLPQVQDVALRVAHLVVPHLPETPEGIATAPFVRDVLHAFWVTPSRAEVVAWGDFPWEEEVARPYVPIAQRISTGSVLERLSRGETRLRRPNGWRAGSAMISPQPWRGLLQSRAWLEENRSQVQRWRRRLQLAVVKRVPRR